MRREALGQTGDRPDVFEEVNAFDQLHGEKPFAALGEELPQADQVGVLQILESTELFLEAQKRIATHGT